jgi:hypothetical protein
LAGATGAVDEAGARVRATVQRSKSDATVGVDAPADVNAFAPLG